MSLRVNLSRLGVALIILGSVFSLFYYPQWSFQTSSYGIQCTGINPASSCGSIQSSAAALALFLTGGILLTNVGLVLAIIGAVQSRRSGPRPIA
jgi:hypothetical protein